MSWPHAHGGHRGDHRSDAPGAARGEIRWRWRRRFRKAPSRPLVLGDRIAVVTGRTLWLVDPNGATRSCFALPPDASLHLLTAAGPVIADGTRLEQRDWTGAMLWQHDLGQRVAAVQRSLAGDVAVCTHERGYPPRGHLLVLDARGNVRWHDDDHGIVGAVFDAPQLAFDDEGNLYTSIAGRLGDGVSGDDVATGGCRGYDRNGARLWPGTLGGREIQASARGVLALGMGRVHAYDPTGVLQWDAPFDDGDVCVALDRELVRTRCGLPRLLDRRPGGGGTVCQGIYDRDGVFYFAKVLWSPPHTDGVAAINPDNTLRWHVPLTPIDYTIPLPVIGPEATLLLAYGNEVLAIG